MLRYTVLRFLIFFGCLAALWLAGLRGQANQFTLVIAAAVLSLVISSFALRSFRHDLSAQIGRKFEDRAARQGAAPAAGSDEAAEDAETSD